MTSPRFTGSTPARLFVRGVGLVYAAAFLSLAVQVTGLLGARGILPAADLVAAIRERGYGLADWPSLFYFGASDGALELACWAGVVAGLGVALGILRVPLLLVAWVLYSSLVLAGQSFLSFQWDALLLECGVLAPFLAGTPTRAGTLAWRWLLFRLMLESGWVKLASGDPTWRNLTALRYHFETQPLPNPVAWVAHKLPDWLLAAGVAGTLAIELVLPFAVFLPRPFARKAFLPLALLQVLILLTGNYGFFNVLSLLLCLALLAGPPGGTERAPGRLRNALAWAYLAFAGVAGVAQLGRLAGVTTPLSEVAALARRHSLVNSYGLFAVMTTERDEIELEGSRDGQDWRGYVFKYKPGPLDRAPPVVPLHMPRLDWQMWFAALGPVEQSPWLLGFAQRLLEGSPAVSALLAEDPFAGGPPPRFVRARLYRYHFTKGDELAEHGLWWRREDLRVYLPPVSLKEGR